MLLIEFNKSNSHKLKILMSQGKKIFLLVYTDSCGACRDVIPEWNKLSVLQNINTNNVVIAKFKVNFGDKALESFPRIQSSSRGVPKLLYINGLHSVESFKGENRTSQDFIHWILACLSR